MSKPKLKNCHDCGAKPGSFHQPGCDVERCPYCGGQLLLCSHQGKTNPPPDDDRMPWTGEWPGVKESQEFGWYAKAVPGGWKACAKDDPGASVNEAQVELTRSSSKLVPETDPLTEPVRAWFPMFSIVRSISELW